MPDLQISAIPLYEQIIQHFYSAKRKPTLFRVRIDWNKILENLTKLKYYFTNESVEFVIERAKLLFYPSDIKLMSQGQALFLWFFPYHSEKQVAKEISFIFDWFDRVGNFAHWTKNWIHALCKISSYHGSKFFNEEFIVKLFCKLSFILERQQVVLSFHADSNWFLKHSFVSNNFFRSLGKLIANIWNESVEDKLSKYLSLNETAFHPSSVTKATKGFAQLIEHLSYFLFRKKNCSGNFSVTLLKYCQLLLFSKDSFVQEKTFKSFKYLSMINPIDTMNWIFDLAECEIFMSDSESHRLLSSLGALTYCVRTILSDKIYPNGFCRLVKLIPSIIAFFDASNPQKSIGALDLLFSIFHFLPYHPISDEELLFDIYYSFLTTSFNALNELEVTKDKILTPEFGFAAMILMVLKHLIHQIPSSIYVRLLEKMNFLFTEKLFFSKNVFLPRLFGILKGRNQEQFLSTFLSRIFQNLTLFVEEKDEKMIEWNLHLLCRIVNQSGSELLVFRQELLHLFTLDLSSFDSDEIPRYLYKLLKLVLTNFLSIYPLEYGSSNYLVNDQPNLSCSNTKTESPNSTDSSSFDFTQPLDCSQVHINWHLIQKEEVDFCAQLIGNFLSKIDGLPKLHSVLALKAILKGIAYLAIQSTKTVIYQDCSSNSTVPFSNSSCTLKEDGISSIDLCDFANSIRSKCLLVLQNMPEVDKFHYKTILEIISCWKEIVLPKSFYPNKLQKILASIKLLKSSLIIYPKRHDLARAIFVQRCYAYHLQRCVLDLEEQLLDENCLKFIIHMAMSDFDQIRSSAVTVLGGIVTFYDSSIEHILDYLGNNFDSAPSAEKTKGLLGIFNHSIVPNLISNNLLLLIKFIRFIFSFTLQEEALEAFINLFRRLEQSFSLRTSDSRLFANTEGSGQAVHTEIFDMLQFLLPIASDISKHYTVRLAALSVIHLFTPVRGLKWPESFLQFFLQNTIDTNQRMREYCIVSCSNIQYLSKAKNEKQFLTCVSNDYFIDKPCYTVNEGNVLAECKLKLSETLDKSPFLGGSLLASLDRPYFSKLFSIFINEDQKNNERNLNFFKAIFHSFTNKQMEFVLEECTILLENPTVPHYEHHVSCVTDIFAAALKKLPPSVGIKFASLLPDSSPKCNLSIFHLWIEAVGRIYARKDPRRYSYLTEIILQWPIPLVSNYLDFSKKILLETSLLERTHWRLIEKFSSKIDENFQHSFYSEDFAQQLVLYLAYAWENDFSLCQNIFPKILSLHTENSSVFLNFYTLLIVDHCNQHMLKSDFFKTATKLFFLLEEKNDSVYNKSLADTKNTFADLYFSSDLLLFALGSFSDISNWKIYCDNLKTINRSFIRNAFSFSSQETFSLLNQIKSLAINHKHAEVKQVCSHFITGIVMYFCCELNLLGDCNELFNIFYDSNSSKTEKQGAILNIIGYLNAFPYTIEKSWMPEVLERLANVTLHDKTLVVSSCRKFFLDFKRTHHDNWHVDKDKFSDEQLSLLSDLIISPSYYA